VAWVVEFLDGSVRAELEALPRDIIASFLRISRLIASEGLEKVHEPYVKHLEGPLWEMRMKGKDGIARAAYVTATGRRVVVVRVFGKKTQKTPRREIELALKRAKEVR
jgi:phage-related protein